MESRIIKMITAAVLSVFFTFSGQTYAAGLLKPVIGNTSDVYMKSHYVNVTINNGFSRTEVDQVFFNTGTKDIEAIYSFPVPDDASLSELSLWINGSEVTGEVFEKQKARKIYEDQKSKGNDTAIAEKNEYRTFDVSVSPVRANQETRVRLVYYQPLEITLNVGRYVYPVEEGGVDMERLSFWSVDNVVTGTFKFDLELKSTYPVQDVRIPGFENKASIFKDDTANNYNISINSSEGSSLSKDIVFYYRLKDDTPARVELVPFREMGHDGSFMVVVTPGGVLKKLNSGTDWTFVLDTSGSMNGEKIRTLAQGVVKTINNMNANDRFRIITFSDTASDFSGGYITATKENIIKMAKRIKNINSGGSTALYAGLEMAYKGFDHDRTTGIILVTDGVANDGPSNDIDILELHRKYDVRVYTIVIGNSANRPLLKRIAKDSGGFTMNISTSDDLSGKILLAKAKLTHECLYDTELKFSGADVQQLTPNKIGNLYKGQQVVMFGKYTKPGRVSISLTGRLNGEKKEWTCEAVLPETDTDNPEIERLWALSTIKNVMGEIQESGVSDKLRKKVVDLGVEYSLVTDYTAMVVVDEIEAEELGFKRNNAKRIKKERDSQKSKSTKPGKNYRVDKTNSSRTLAKSNKPTFNGSSSPGIGTGPVGPFFIMLLLSVMRRKRK